MGKAAKKSTKKFAASGQLHKVIQARRNHQQIRNRTRGKKTGKDGKGMQMAVKDEVERGEGSGEGPLLVEKSKTLAKNISIDDFPGGTFIGSDDGAEEELDLESVSEVSEDDEDPADDESFASIDELEEEGEAHLMELSKLAENDPEFYEYLQENDRELLQFDASAAPGLDKNFDKDSSDDDAMEGAKIPILGNGTLKRWQKALLEQRSLRALRKLLIAFRSAAHMNEDDQVLAWSIDSSSVYNKLVTTTLRYTPVVLEYHVPYRTLSCGKFKPPTETRKLKILQKLITAYFRNVIHIFSQLTDTEMLHLALTESAKIVPYIVSSRKVVKLYLKKCLELWSTAQDNIRIAAFIAIRKLASATDESIMDTVLKNTYLTFVRSSKSTGPYSLPSINLMKNSASEIFCVDHATVYQHAFGYIRQLAIHLRNSMKLRTKEAYKVVYNWQYVHCVDFWAIVLARACDTQTITEKGGMESELKPLIYPFVQVSLGAVKLISNARSYPFHLHILRSLLHLSQRTETYIPLLPYLLPILTQTLTPSARPKSSSLRPLDFEVQVLVPQHYLKTRVYAEGLIEESVFVLAEWLASRLVHGSISFPELTVPIIVVLRKVLKNAKLGGGNGKYGKELSLIKGVLERIEDSSRWIEQKRKTVVFGPGKMESLEGWEGNLRTKIEDSPLGKYVRVQRKTREKRRQLIQKAREGEDEILEG